MRMCISRYTCKLEINFQCYSSLQEPSPGGFETGSLPGTQSSPIRLNWPASKPQEPVCLHLLNTGITSVCHHTYFFNVCSEFKLTELFPQPKSMSPPSSAVLHVSCSKCSSVRTRLGNVLQGKCDQCYPCYLGFQGEKKGRDFQFPLPLLTRSRWLGCK